MNLNSSVNPSESALTSPNELNKSIAIPQGALPQPSQEEDEADLQQIFGILKRRAPLILRVGLVMATAVSAWVLLQPAEYTGEFRLLIEPVTKGSRLANTLTSSNESTQISAEAFGVPYDPEYVSQIEVLKSEKLLKPLTKTIQARYPDITYEELAGGLKIINPKDTKILEISYPSEDPEQIQFVLSTVAQGYLKYSVDDRQRNLRQGLDFVNKQVSQQQENVAKLSKQLQQFRESNGLVKPDTEAESLSRQMSELISQQRENRVKLQAAQSLYASLQEEVDYSPTVGVAIANLSESPSYQQLINKLNEADAKLANELGVFQAGSPDIQLLVDQRNQIAALVQQEAERILQRVPDAAFEQAGYQGTVGRDLIQQMINSANQVNVLSAQDQAISLAGEELTGQIQDLAGVSRVYNDIQQNLQTTTESLNRLLAARDNLQLEYARQQAPWELISEINESSISDVSGTSRKLILGIFASALMGVGAAFLTEKLDRVFHTSEDLKDVGLPCLGVIPFYPQLQKELVLKGAMVEGVELEAPNGKPDQPHRYQMVPFLEAFYSLDANIRLLGSDTAIRSITISSTSPADGKSTVSAHLALAAATMGRRVLLVDTDMRLPQVHRRFDIPNMRGLSSILTSNIEIDQGIQPSLQDPNLYLLPAGPTPPSPGRLLSSNRMQSLARHLSSDYDLVIYDSPPLQGFADAKLSAAYTDGILLVVGLGKTDRAEFKQVLDDLNTTVQAPILGIVANGLKKGTNRSNAYHYQKYYQQQDDKQNRKKQKKR